MGKIRIKTLGIKDEEKLRQEEKEKREQKKLRKLAENKKAEPLKADKVNLERKAKKKAVKAAFAKAPATQREAFVKKEKKTEIKKEPVEKVKQAPKPVKEAKEEIKPAAPRKRSQEYRNAAKLVDRKKLYPIKQAIDLVKQTSYSKFVGTIEVHLNCLEKGIKVSLTLPHSTGKERRVVVCNDQIIEEISEGKINFDALIATPDFMPKLARFAKILGPKGLMPNPKAGTVTPNPEKIMAELKAGRQDLKTESASPIIHTIIGKADFDSQKLVDNLEKLIEAIGKEKIKSVFIKATMGPSIKVAF